jgi:hypothetical protein
LSVKWRFYVNNQKGKAWRIAIGRIRFHTSKT